MTTPWWPVTRARAVRQASRAGAECKCSLSACSSSANRANWSSESSGRCCAGGSHRETGCRRLESRVGAWVHGRGDRESSDQQLRNVIENHRKYGKLHEAYYLAAMEELARRKGLGLDLQKSFDLIRKTATERRFLSYKDLAGASGADWSKVRYAVNTHLGGLVDFARGKGWPLLSASIVSQQNVATGKREPATLRGFVEAAHALGYAIVDDEAFLREQQERVFAWAAADKGQQD